MKIQIIITCVLLGLCASCSNNQKNEAPVKTIEVEPTQKIQSEYSFNDFFRLSHIVTLETTDQSVLKDISKIILYRNAIYILDERIGNIVVFSAEGKFLRKISRQGKGHGEYQYAKDFEIKGKMLYVLDGHSARILCYTLPKINFTREIKVAKGTGFKVFDNNHIAINSGLGTADLNRSPQNFGYTFYRNGKVKSRGVETNQHLVGRAFTLEYGNNSFQTFNDTTYALFPLNDTIYRNAKNGVLTPYISIDFGVKRPGVNDNQQQIFSYLNKDLHNNPSSIYAFYKYGSLLMFSYLYGNTKRNVMADISEGKVIFNGTYKDTENDLPIRVTPYSIADSDSQEPRLLLSVFWPFELKVKDKNRHLLKNTDENENPVLFFYKLRGLLHKKNPN